MILLNLKYRLVKFIEQLPFLQIFIYNNLSKFKFLFPHDKDYLALKLLFEKNEKRDFIDVGGNIGLSTIGFRELGYNKNTIHVFEPDIELVKKLNKLKKYYKKILIYNFGLSHKNSKKKLFKAFYRKNYFHFNNSFNEKYIKKKIKENYPDKYKEFVFKSSNFSLKKFDNLKLNINPCFIKIDVEGLDHEVILGMYKLIKTKKPILLIEYNQSNFGIIYKKLKNNYYCFKFDIENKKLKKLNKIEINLLLSGKSLEKKYAKNSVNIFYIHKNHNYEFNQIY